MVSGAEWPGKVSSPGHRNTINRMIDEWMASISTSITPVALFYILRDRFLRQYRVEVRRIVQLDVEFEAQGDGPAIEERWFER